MRFADVSLTDFVLRFCRRLPALGKETVEDEYFKSN